MLSRLGVPPQALQYAVRGMRRGRSSNQILEIVSNGSVFWKYTSPFFSWTWRTRDSNKGSGIFLLPISCNRPRFWTPNSLRSGLFSLFIHLVIKLLFTDLASLTSSGLPLLLKHPPKAHTCCLPSGSSP
uniref:Uncharacterized protein n=1 Tax=Rousettus aegyptiacus TaxID=9407 RepID=A0A7J8D6L4_ROUAE|nr:hypothetical protein HJG63_008901 [Rousettus aegyptiacus]